MDVEKLKSLSVEDRKSVLESEAVTARPDVKYTKPLTTEEVVEYKSQLSENLILQDNILDELKDVKDEFKMRLKPVQQKIIEVKSAVKFKAITCEGTLYDLADFDKQLIHTVDTDGNIINTRMMRPEERQLRIQALKIQIWKIRTPRFLK